MFECCSAFLSSARMHCKEVFIIWLFRSPFFLLFLRWSRTRDSSSVWSVSYVYKTTRVILSFQRESRWSVYVPLVFLSFSTTGFILSLNSFFFFSATYFMGSYFSTDCILLANNKFISMVNEVVSYLCAWFSFFPRLRSQRKRMKMKKRKRKKSQRNCLE